MKRYLYGATILTVASSVAWFAALEETNAYSKSSSQSNVKITG